MKTLIQKFLPRLCMMITIITWSQELPEIIPPSPTVAQLMRFEEMPIDMYTGQPNISIPLFQKSISNNLGLSLTLGYNTQAIRLDERSGWLGTGFTMPVGGTISRTIRGLPDELNSTLYGVGIYHNPFDDYQSFQNLTMDQKQEYLWRYANGKDGEKVDLEYDLYQYSYLGGNGRFIIKKESNNLIAVHLEKESQDKITLTYDTNFIISKIEITNTNGFIFTFETHNQMQYTSYSSTESQFGYSTSVNVEYYGPNDIPNTWYLDTIKTSNSELLCTFTYQTVEENYITPKSYTKYKLLNSNASLINPTHPHHTINRSLLAPKKTTRYQSVNSIQNYVDEIIFIDGTRVKFVLDLNGHPEFGNAINGEIPGGKLSSIIIKRSDGSINKSYDFFYETNPFSRLFLTKISENGGALQYDYLLEYHNKNELPGFDSPKRDSWGYYNGPDSDNPNIILPGFFPNISTTGSIKSITYPTGGKKEFSFESNSFSFQGNTQVDPHKLPQNKTLLQRNGTFNINSLQQFSVEKYLIYFNTSQRIKVNLSNITATPDLILENHKIKFTKLEPIFGSNITVPEGTINYSNYDLSNFNNVSPEFSYSFEILPGDQYSTISAGWYLIELTTPAVYLTQNPANLSLNLNIQYTNFILNSYVMHGGGIRIKNIKYTDGENEAKLIDYIYNENPFVGNFGTPMDLLSSGSFEVDYNSQTYIKGKTHPFISSISCNLIGTVVRSTQTLNYEVTRHLNEVLTPNTKGNFVGYKYVYKKEVGNGGILHTFISPRDIQIQSVNNLNYPFITQDNLDYKRGKLEHIEVYDDNQNILKEEIFDYYDVSEIVYSSIFPYESQLSDCPWDQFYQHFNHYKNNWVDHPFQACPLDTHDNIGTCYNIDSDMGFTSADNTKGMLLTMSVTTKEYFYPATGAPIIKEVRKEFDYNPQNYQVSVEDTYYDKSGSEEHLQTKYYYPVGISLNSNTGTIKNTLVNLNKINEVLEMQSYRNGVKLSEMHNIYHQFATNQVLLKEVKVGKNTLTPDKRIEFHRYDSYGNVLEVSKAEGTKISYIYGFNGSLPVAKITNANYSQVESIIGTTMLTGNLTTSQRNNLLNGLGSAMINFLEHDPAVGITKTYNERALLNSYDYDPFNRLIRVKDHAGKVEGFNAYNYKNQY